MILMYILCSIITLGFTLLLTLSFRRKLNSNSSVSVTGLSIVIPFRNEAENFPRLIDTLVHQDITIPFEIILIDDNSDDHFAETLMPLLAVYEPAQIIVLSLELDSDSPLTSKQQALDFGVVHAQYDWLVFTDADMFFTPQWLQALIASAEEQKSSFVFGRTAVAISGLFSWLQHIQLQFLFAVGWLFATSRIDSSCMGNNILLEKSIYQRVGGQKGVGYSIVEDQALLKAIRDIGIKPVPATPFSKEAFTYPEETFLSYSHQMLRWSRGGAKGSLQLLSAMLLLGLYLVLLPVSIITHAGLLILPPTAILLLYLIKGYKGINELKLLLSFPVLMVWIFIETILLLPIMLFVKPIWKGRTLS